MSLTGWQAIAAILIASGLAIAGAMIPGGAALLALASSIVTGTFALLQPRRDPTSRTRAGDRGDRDRTSTAALGVPTHDRDRSATPREPVVIPPGARRP